MLFVDIGLDDARTSGEVEKDFGFMVMVSRMRVNGCLEKR